MESRQVAEDRAVVDKIMHEGSGSSSSRSVADSVSESTKITNELQARFKNE